MRKSVPFLSCALFVLLILSPAISTPINKVNQKSFEASIENIEAKSELIPPAKNFLKDTYQNEKTFLPRNDVSLYSKGDFQDSYLTLQKSGKAYRMEAPVNSIFLSMQEDTTTASVDSGTVATTTTVTDAAQAQADATTAQAPDQVTVQVDTTTAAAPDATTEAPVAATTEVTTTTTTAEPAPAASAEAPATTSTTVTSTDAGTTTSTTTSAPAASTITTTVDTSSAISDEIEKITTQLDSSLETIKTDLQNTNEQLLDTLKTEVQKSTQELVEHVKTSTKQISADVKAEGKKTRAEVSKSTEEIKKDVKVVGAKVDVNIGETISLKVLFLQNELKEKKQQLDEVQKEILELEAKLPVEGAGICGNHGDCATCTKDPRCGWCSAESKCVEGDKVGPLYESCSFYDYEVCTGSACAQYKECSVTLIIF